MLGWNLEKKLRASCLIIMLACLSTPSSGSEIERNDKFNLTLDPKSALKSTIKQCQIRIKNISNKEKLWSLGKKIKTIRKKYLKKIFKNKMEKQLNKQLKNEQKNLKKLSQGKAVMTLKDYKDYIETLQHTSNSKKASGLQDMFKQIQKIEVLKTHIQEYQNTIDNRLKKLTRKKKKTSPSLSAEIDFINKKITTLKGEQLNIQKAQENKDIKNVLTKIPEPLRSIIKKTKEKNQSLYRDITVFGGACAVPVEVIKAEIKKREKINRALDEIRNNLTAHK